MLSDKTGPQRCSADKQRGTELKIESAQTLDAVLAAIPDVMFLMDGQGRYRDVYAKGKEHLLFAPAETIIGKSAFDVFDAERAAFFTAAVMKVLATGDEVRIEYPLELQGNMLYFEARIVPVLRQHPEEQFVLVIIREVTMRHEQEQKALLVEKVFEDATEGIMIESSGRQSALWYCTTVQIRLLRMKMAMPDSRMGSQRSASDTDMANPPTGNRAPARTPCTDRWAPCPWPPGLR